MQICNGTFHMRRILSAEKLINCDRDCMNLTARTTREWPLSIPLGSFTYGLNKLTNVFWLAVANRLSLVSKSKPFTPPLIIFKWVLKMWEKKIDKKLTLKGNKFFFFELKGTIKRYKLNKRWIYFFTTLNIKLKYWD